MGARRVRGVALAWLVALAITLAGCGDKEKVLGPTPTPEITGGTASGQVLTGHAGTWGPGDVTLSYRWQRDGDDIAGAVESTYTLTPEDVSHALTLKVTGTREGYTTASQTSKPTATVAGMTMTTSKPAITGSPVVGQTLKAEAVDWGAAGATYTSQWLRDDAPIDGATGATYVVTSADTKHRLTVTVTAKAAGYADASATSDPVGPIGDPAVNATNTPQLTGTPRYFATLSVPDPKWGPAGVTLTYRWIRDKDTLIDDATGPKYQLRGRDIGHTIKVEVIGSAPGFTTARKTTAATAKIGKGAFDPAPRPTMAGTVAVGSTLTAQVSGWGPEPPTAWTWQWYRNKVEIPGATQQTYALTAADNGAAIQVRATGSAQFMDNHTRYSMPTAAAGAGALTAPVPVFNGVAQVGQVITAVPRAWGPGDVKLSYQWYRAKDPIAGATAAAYRATADDVGKRLRVKVTGAKPGFATASTVSGWTNTITPGAISAGTPIVSGRPLVGQVLTANPGTWGPGKIDLKYQWLSDGRLLGRAVGQTYTPSGADVGHAISVRVTGSRRGFTTAVATSLPTPAITGRQPR